MLLAIASYICEVLYLFIVMSIALGLLIKSKFTELLDCSKAGMFTLIWLLDKRNWLTLFQRRQLQNLSLIKNK